LDRVVSRSQVDPNIVVQIHHREAILALVLAGAGVAVLPAPMAHDARTRGAVVRPLRPAVTRRIGVVHRPGLLSPAATAMLTLSKEHKTRS
ncbi:MAG: LysR family transcriptional regulator substrate-binding protein, partial [Ilumatobacteraceae bacterium]|nr:LysR family transcriptional regulator substrate-binding protein [Ilumatobacteraceae bacterium]